MRETLDRFRIERRVFADERTGREVWQVTDGEFECVAPYPEKPAWTPDDRCFFFACNKLGSWQPYRLEVETGEVQQLFSCENAMYRSVVYEPNRNEVYVEHAGTFVAVNPDTLEARVAVDYGDYFGRKGGHKGRAAVLSSDGTLTAFGWRTPYGHSAIVVATTDGSNEFKEVIMDRDEFLAPGHLMFRPGDNNYVACAAGIDRQNDPNEKPFFRGALYHVDLTTGHVEPLVLMPTEYRATHCTWGRSGERIYFHRKTLPKHVWVPTALCSFNSEGEDLRVHYETGDHRLGHSQANPDETWIVTDSQDLDENILLLAGAERDEQHLLCWPNTSINSGRPDRRPPDLPPHNDCHTHPGFSHTGRCVHYTSDVSGRSQVYMAPVADVVGE